MHWASLEASALGSLIADCPAWKKRREETIYMTIKTVLKCTANSKSRMLLLQHSAAMWLLSHQLREAEADHHQIRLADKTLWRDSSSVRCHIDTYLMSPRVICEDVLWITWITISAIRWVHEYSVDDILSVVARLLYRYTRSATYSVNEWSVILWCTDTVQLVLFPQCQT